MTLIALAVVLALLAGGLYGVWLSSEEARAERQKFHRIVSANSESRQWPAPTGPKGGAWRDRRER